MERLVSGSSPLTFAGYLVKVLFNTFGPLCSLHQGPGLEFDT
jgi:hypothetical protein